MKRRISYRALPCLIAVAVLLFASGLSRSSGRPSPALSPQATAPSPLLRHDHPVDWWFVFKLNSGVFPGCSGNAERQCIFGGKVQNYSAFGQQFVFASSEDQSLHKGSDCAGDSTDDPIGATFDQVYNHALHYVIWNDQFYSDPEIAGCGDSCSSPWGHSKGMLAWDDSGEGFVLQVTTPSWPAAGSKGTPRKTDGNTLGCVKDNDVKVSQHFFALKVDKDDVLKIVGALENASVVTDIENPQIVNNGGPADVRDAVNKLGVKSKSGTVMHETLSTGVTLISKPSALHVPPWQMVSSLLGGTPLRAATWWMSPAIPSTTKSTTIGCWDDSLSKPGAVQIATTGQFEGKVFGLKGGGGNDFNHAKIGVSTSSSRHFVIFADMNQQGTLSGSNCGSSQNGRGGLFYVLDQPGVFESVSELIMGESAPTAVTR